MSTADIVRLTIDDYQEDNFRKALNLKVTSSTEILKNTGDYLVSVEKLEVPVNGINMPIDASNKSYYLMIFNDNKPADLLIPGLSFGPNWFNFTGPFYSIDDFLRALNDFVLKKASPLNLGQFIYDAETELINYTYNEANEALFINIHFYFDVQLLKLLSFNRFYNEFDTTTHDGIAYTRFTPVPNPVAGKQSKSNSIIQSKSTIDLFYTLKSIRVYSTLPTDPYRIYDMKQKTCNDSQLLTEITFNSKQMYNISNLLYIPTTFRYSSMQTMTSLNNFQLLFFYKYASGVELPIYLDHLDYASIHLAFHKKKTIDEEILI